MKKTGIMEKINRGFRVWLFETGIKVQQTDFENRDEGHEVAGELQRLIWTLDRKFFAETRYFLPALALKAPFSVSLLEEEKNSVEMHTRTLEKLVQVYFQPGTRAYVANIGSAVQESFCKLLAVLMMYMNHQDSISPELRIEEHIPENWDVHLSFLLSPKTTSLTKKNGADAVSRLWVAA